MPFRGGAGLARTTVLPPVRSERAAAPRESPQGRQPPVLFAPDVGLDEELVLSRLVDVEAPRFAAPVGPRLSESGRDRNRRSTQAARCDLELVSLGDGGLVDVAGEDQL